VPGKIIACFRAPRTIQATYDDAAIEYTKKLWNQLNSSPDYDVNKIDSIWSLLSDEQVEDLIFLYLQTKDWYVVPNSRKKDTMSYEFYLINKFTLERAIVQAKTGESYINLLDYYNVEDRVFIFQPHDNIRGEIKVNFSIIAKEEMESFIANNEGIIPKNIIKWQSQVVNL